MNKNTNANVVGANVFARNHRGITLVALIITIIIMLLLVGVSITIAIKGGLFDTAKRAAKETEEAKKLEQELASGRVKIDGVWYDSIEDYTKGNASDDQTEPEKPVEPEKPPVKPETPPKDPSTGLSFYDDVEKDENGVLTANASYASDGKTAVIPKGFKIVEGIERTKSIADGLVIQDKDGNEFVWIPVEVTESDTETEIASFYTSNWENNARGERSSIASSSDQYLEPKNDYAGEAKEYEEMVKSVYKNGGFYIGRYEAGSTTQRVYASPTTEMVVQKDKYPYNYVAWGASASDWSSDVVVGATSYGKGAVYLSKKMYEGKDVGVTSTLCYGVQWDAMLDFIKDKNNVTNSASWGNCKPDSGTTTLKNTGSSDSYSAKNIYDVSGNLFEGTMEGQKNANYARVTRGNDYYYGGQAATRGIQNVSTFNMDTLGFRPTLYIK